jgi:DNA-binding transcriptional LysR family regulator
MWPTVELREIRVFLTLADELHFGHTAERLDLTPSRVSQTIRALEARVGGRLFERTSRRVKLTPLGEQLQARMAPAYEELRRAYEETADAATGVAGTVRLAMCFLGDAGPHVLEIIKTFEKRHPACRVQVIETYHAGDQVGWLRKGEADMLAVRLPPTQTDVVVGPIVLREQRVLAVADAHPLARRSMVYLDDLADYIVSDAGAIAPDLIGASIPARTPSGQKLRRAQAHSIPEAMVRVAAGEIVHATVPTFLDSYHHRGVLGVPIGDVPGCDTVLVWLRGAESLKIQAFVRAATDVLQSHTAGPPFEAKTGAPETTRRAATI